MIVIGAFNFFFFGHLQNEGTKYPPNPQTETQSLFDISMCFLPGPFLNVEPRGRGWEGFHQPNASRRVEFMVFRKRHRIYIHAAETFLLLLVFSHFEQ